MSENTLRTRPPTFPISKPGRWPQPALPPLASARNTFAQIRCHYLWQPEQRDIDAHHGMPADVERSLREQRFLRSPGQHAPDPVRRRLASWSTLTKWRGLTVPSPPLRCPPPIRLAVLATPPPRKGRSAKAVTGDVLAQMLATCGTDSLRGYP
jgi:hypothetical protein